MEQNIKNTKEKDQESKKEEHKEFSFSTISEFDNHISKSIVDYDSIIEDIVLISDYFIEEGENYYDIGCSTGKLVKRIGNRNKNSNCIGVEIENNFDDELQTINNVRFDKKDVRLYSFRDISFCTSIFTLQFIPIKDRQNIVNKIYKSMNKGAGFILLEKVYYNNSKINSMVSSIAYDYKLSTFTEKEILSKERDLRKIMKIRTLEQNIEMLKKAGFSNIEMFWRRHNFIGLLAIK